MSLSFAECRSMLGTGWWIIDKDGGLVRGLNGLESNRYDHGIPWLPYSPLAYAESKQAAPKQEPAGRKDDAGKPRWSLVPLEVVREVEAAIEDDVAPPPEEARGFAFDIIFVHGHRTDGLVNAIAGLIGLLGPNARHAAWAEVTRAFEHGAQKYGDDNWRKVEPERYINAAYRHLFLESGPDKDSGIDAVAHAIASLVIYRALTKESK